MKLETFGYKDMPTHLGDVAKPFYDLAKIIIQDMKDCDVSKSLKSLRTAQKQAVKAKFDMADSDGKPLHRELKFD